MNVQMSKFPRTTIIWGAVFCLLSVVIGAFSAHLLKDLFDEYALGLVEIAARYQMYHGLALILFGLIIAYVNFPSTTHSRWYLISVAGFILGVLLFCGSLYLIAFSGNKAFGMITPIGGFAFILGWCGLIAALLVRKT